MALVVGNKVHLSVNTDALSTDPPLFGVVDRADGDAPDVVRVVWENGATSIFQTDDETDVGLVICAVDGSAAAHVGMPHSAFNLGGIILRTFMVGPTRRAVVQLVVAVGMPRLLYTVVSL